ncbi:hypothetical protein [Paraflavitalea pollutisoli]|uniref:hypothetical protein n=1 Tax=Paraflavitalea pollutisoli TaxID=3034143 RepID=UPI0023EBB7AF|nr:hypothetical protein [Paraflavitalea sp. H1-2-19X]
MKRQSTTSVKRQKGFEIPMSLFTPPTDGPIVQPTAAQLPHPLPHPLRDAVFQQLQLLQAPVLRARNLKLYGKMLNPQGLKRTEVPDIRLSGKWMHDAGFTQMDRFFLYAYDGMIILVPQGPPPCPEARQSWEGHPSIWRKRKKTKLEIERESVPSKYAVLWGTKTENQIS